MAELSEDYCERCGYDFKSEEEEESSEASFEVPEYVRNFVLRLTGIVL